MREMLSNQPEADIRTLIPTLAQEGRRIIVLSSEEEELIGLSDRIAIFHHGRCEQSPVPVEALSLRRLRQDARAPSIDQLKNRV